MALNRRSFIGLGSLALCGAALHPGAVYSAPLVGGLPLWEGDAEVFAFVKSYSSNFRVVGGSVLGRIRASGARALNVIVEVQDLGQMQSALASAPFQGIYSHDNVLNFALKHVDVTLENLLPAEFAARLAALKKRAGVAFAHDALVYDPATNLLTDPFAGRAGALKIVNKTFGGALALDVALRGTTDAADLRLTQGQDFVLWKSRVLQQIAKKLEAQKLSATFLQQLAALAEKLPAASVAKILRTRLIATALKQVFQLQVEDVIATFQSLRASSPAETTDAALWLAALLAPEIEGNVGDGAATTWLQRGNRFQVLRSRRALAEAQTVLQG